MSTCYFEYGRHVARLRHRRRAYAPTSNTVSHDNFDDHDTLGGPSGRQNSAINKV